MTGTAPRSIRLYDLMLENCCTISPFVWRIKFAIAHKGFAIESIPARFARIRKILGGKYDRLPNIDDGGTLVNDSLAIAGSIFTAASAAIRGCVCSLHEVKSWV